MQEKLENRISVYPRTTAAVVRGLSHSKLKLVTLLESEITNEIDIYFKQTPWKHVVLAF